MAKGVLLRHRDFRLLWGGETVSELGSQVSLLAIPLLAVRTLHATAFLGSVAGLATNPVDRRRGRGRGRGLAAGVADADHAGLPRGPGVRRPSVK